MFKPVMASILALAATATLAVSALAAGATAQHFNLSSPQQCSSKGPYTFCTVQSGEETAVQTPAGNFSGDVNVTSTFTVTYNGAIVESGSSAFSEHVLYTSNFTVVQEGGIHQSSTFTDGVQTCTFSQDLHVTDLNLITGTGNIQYNNVTSVCV
jgi:hypothetical protein